MKDILRSIYAIAVMIIIIVFTFETIKDIREDTTRSNPLNKGE